MENDDVMKMCHRGHNNIVYVPLKWVILLRVAISLSDSAQHENSSNGSDFKAYQNVCVEICVFVHVMLSQLNRGERWWEENEMWKNRSRACQCPVSDNQLTTKAETCLEMRKNYISIRVNRMWQWKAEIKMWKLWVMWEEFKWEKLEVEKLSCE